MIASIAIYEPLGLKGISMEGLPLRPVGHTILEIKVQEAMPLWLSAILAEGRIYKNSFSKYGEAFRQQLAGAPLAG